MSTDDQRQTVLPEEQADAPAVGTLRSLPARPQTQPPLGIVHILVWTLGSGVLLAAHRSIYALQADRVPGQLPPQFQVWLVVNSIVHGAAVSGIVLWVARAVRRSAPFPVQPGHWLLLWIGLGVIMEWAIMVVAPWLAESPLFSLIMGAYFLQTLFFSVAYAATAMLATDTKSWTTFFGILAANHGLSSFTYCTEFVDAGWWWELASLVSSMGGLLAGAAALVLVVTVILDLRSGRYRDWLHWTGVVVYVAGGLLQLNFVWWGWVPDSETQDAPSVAWLSRAELFEVFPLGSGEPSYVFRENAGILGNSATPRQDP